MQWLKDSIQVTTNRKGMHPITSLVEKRIRDWNIQEGICFLFIQHASASILINESYDPSAKADMEGFLDRLSPENHAWHQHTLEGADDSPAHLRTMLTQTDLTIPIDNSQLSLGTWQGIYLFEHRRRGQHRHILIRCLKVG